MPYPSLTKDMHHEVELVVALKSGGRNIPVAKLQYQQQEKCHEYCNATRHKPW